MIRARYTLGHPSFATGAILKSAHPPATPILIPVHAPKPPIPHVPRRR